MRHADAVTSVATRPHVVDVAGRVGGRRHPHRETAALARLPHCAPQSCRRAARRAAGRASGRCRVPLCAIAVRLKLREHVEDTRQQSRGMPRPVSATVTLAVCPAASIDTRIWPPRSVYFAALFRRFENAWAIRVKSATIHSGCGGISRVRVAPALRSSAGRPRWRPRPRRAGRTARAAARPCCA